VITPNITSISPTSGPVGTPVTITGTGFGTTQGSGLVWLGTKYATVVSWSDTQVVVTVASGSATGGTQVFQNGVWSNAVTFTVVACPLATQPPPSSFPPGDEVWIDDTAGTSPEPVWDTTQAASGTQSLTLVNTPPGVQSGFGFGLDTWITPAASDQFVAYVLIDPCNPPTTLGFTWSASQAGKVYGAYWGEPNPQWDATTWWTRLGPLPAAGSWVRLTAPASELAGLVVDVSNTYQIGGKVWYDRYGRQQ
jgi:hypothetical protein